MWNNRESESARWRIVSRQIIKNSSIHKLTPVNMGTSLVLERDIFARWVLLTVDKNDSLFAFMLCWLTSSRLGSAWICFPKKQRTRRRRSFFVSSFTQLLTVRTYSTGRPPRNRWLASHSQSVSQSFDGCRYSTVVTYALRRWIHLSWYFISPSATNVTSTIVYNILSICRLFLPVGRGMDQRMDGQNVYVHARLLFLARVLLARAARKDINRIHDPRMRVRAPSTVLTNSVCTYVSTYLR